MRTTIYIVSTTSSTKVIYTVGENGAHYVKRGAHLEFPLKNYPVTPGAPPRIKKKKKKKALRHY